MNYRTLAAAILIALAPFAGKAQSVKSQNTAERPKLVVGIVVDQLRNDYLQRYGHQLTGGFKRMLDEGFYCANNHFSYVPTYTGPGHASVYTGTTPAVHGIASNNWYDPRTKEGMYCVQDKSVRTIGIENADGQMSPLNLKTTTITDELMLSLNFRSKVVGMSIKDRGAILPAGHLGKAYWYSKGKFISSSFYYDALPGWVTGFNDQNLVDKYLAMGWDLLLPIDQYTSSLPDDSPYESKWVGEDAPLMPKNLKALVEANGKDNVFRLSPHGNTILLDFAKAAVKAEQMGKDANTDFLCISFSTPDYMGHAMGARAVEVQDMYLRLDRELGTFFDFLDKEVGKGQYTVFLTADHGAADVPQFSIDNQLPGGYIDAKGMQDRLGAALLSHHAEGATFVEKVEEDRIFLDRQAIAAVGAQFNEVRDLIVRTLRNEPGIYNAYPTEEILSVGGGAEFPLKQLSRGLYPPLAGDIAVMGNSGWILYGPVGTTHGSAWTNDTHVPLIFFGKGIPKGITYRETNIRDIAPTLSMLMRVSLPSGATGSPILEVLK